MWRRERRRGAQMQGSLPLRWRRPRCSRSVHLPPPQAAQRSRDRKCLLLKKLRPALLHSSRRMKGMSLKAFLHLTDQ
ncbi:hypothetical protein GDO78_021968 [Eleutherodactylus coqui]|uniref:Uncharacterized protein n=1 Tax=Eleutherodactylus coqui TaxID=57060 RepID=A0A8J6C506_ELECQ|nr:hypothetical protein GDO78_021968 [Eleutherodactylus coqui]